MKSVSSIRNVCGACAAAGGVLFMTGCVASGADAQTLADAASAVTDGGAVSSFLEGVAKNYPWLTVVLLVVGGLRVVFKPVMTLLDSYIKANCSADEYARIQSFEAGPIYRWLCFGFDLVGSVKLPVIGVKPSGQSAAVTESTKA